MKKHAEFYANYLRALDFFLTSCILILYETIRVIFWCTVNKGVAFSSVKIHIKLGGNKWKDIV